MVFAHRPGAETHRETCDGGRMAEPRAMVDIVRAQHLARELLHQVILFVRAFGGGEQTDRRSRRFALDRSQPARDEIERGFPIVSTHGPRPAPALRALPSSR